MHSLRASLLAFLLILHRRTQDQLQYLEFLNINFKDLMRLALAPSLDFDMKHALEHLVLYLT